MESPVQEQISQLHTVYTSVTQDILLHLVAAGALSKESGRTIVQDALKMLQTAPAQGRIRDAAEAAFQAMEREFAE